MAVTVTAYVRPNQIRLLHFSNRLLVVETGQYQISKKNILVNREQLVYVGSSIKRGRITRGALFVVLRIPVIRSVTMAPAALRLVEGSSMDKSKALDAALSADRAQFRQGLDHAARQAARSMDIDTVSTGSLGLDIALGVGGLPRGRVVEIYGPECSGKTTLALHYHRRSPEEGRHLRLYRRRARARPDLCAQARRQRRRSSDLAARRRRAGARNRRHAGSLRRGRCAGDRFGGRAGAARRARRRDGRRAARPAGAVDEPGAAQAHRLDQHVSTPW